ncbi:hypothetical protein BJV78DRAFT_1221993 [Lactifluus subvellereus]|nr:hypothetical protein BJV78DRAFT_1221993 [Lactifluus subvellereus]
MNDVVTGLMFLARCSQGKGSYDRNAFRYIVLNPLIRILAKLSESALQFTQHAPCSAPFMYLTTPEERLKSGALYAECAVVPVRILAPSIPPAKEKKSARKRMLTTVSKSAS